MSRVRLAPFQGGNAAIESALPLPEKDRPVLGAAIRHGCEALATGDKTHFGKLYGKTIHHVAIHSPRSLAGALGIVRGGSDSHGVSATRAKYKARRSKAHLA